MTFATPAQPYAPDWPAPSPRFLRPALPPAPELPLHAVFAPRWADWMQRAAEAKSAPPDYVMAALLAAAGAAIGNTRLAAPWSGWSEPPILWTMAIGAPSSNKSPGLDAVLSPLKRVETQARKAMEAERAAWLEKAEIAKLAESAWKEAARAAVKDGTEPPARPAAADPGDEPFAPRYAVADGTVERLAVIVARQPRGTLMARDELAGWLQGMTRYAGGGSDRPFWLETYGGRSYTVERMGRAPVHIERLSIGVTGSIQPDRLRSLLLKSDDDGLLPRFLPIWPDPAPIRRPRALPDEAFLETALARLHGLQMATDTQDTLRPWLVPFEEEARAQLDRFRLQVRAWEAGQDGVLCSFIGKLPGLAVRLSLVLAYLDWLASAATEPQAITAPVFARAALLVETYALPMARRAYGDASGSRAERAARTLLALIREHAWARFSSRDVLRLDRSGLGRQAELNPALAALEEAEIIRGIETAPGPLGGRPARLFLVNPAVLAAAGSPHDGG